MFNFLKYSKEEKFWNWFTKNQLKNELVQNPYVQQIAGAANHVGESMDRNRIIIGTTEKDVLTYRVGANYFETMGLQLRQGRFFDAQRNIEDATAVIVNKAQPLWKPRCVPTI